jgi:hypothetical protein
MDIVQNLKDLSIETQLHIDENGNVVNTLIMDRVVASLALSDAFTNLGSLSDDTLSNHYSWSWLIENSESDSIAY